MILPIPPTLLSVVGFTSLLAIAYEWRRQRDRQAAHESLELLEQLRCEAAGDAAQLRAQLSRIGDELAARAADPQTRRLAVRCTALAEAEPDPESETLRHLLARRGIDVAGLDR